MSAIDPIEDFHNNGETPEIDLITCPSCAREFAEKDAGRVGYRWLCPKCYGSHPVVVGDVMAALAQDDKECPFV